MAEQNLRVLGHPEYWNERYRDEEESHEWFRSFDKLQPFMQKELPDPSLKPRILHLGCGDSTLTPNLAELNYTDQVSVDFSLTIIAQMRLRYPDLDWRVDDVRHLQFENSSFDVAIDKGTMDAMLYGSPWDPPDEVRENVKKYVDEVARVLRPGGKWIYITYRQPHFVKIQVTCDRVWKLQVVGLDDGPGTFGYFAYIITKLDLHDREAAVKDDEKRSS